MFSYIRFIVIIIGCLTCNFAFALSGSWEGNLTVGGTRLPLVFKFSEENGITKACSIDSPMQNAYNIPAEIQFCSADSISVYSSIIGAEYSGKILTDRIEGNFSQRGYSFDLILTPQAPQEEKRPQTPKPPFPYSTSDVRFSSDDGVELAGTLTIPETVDSNTPCVVMVTGSGLQNRDEEIFEHKPFAVIADVFARNGIASLRYDDRGFGESGGDGMSATTLTFSNDAKAAVEYIRDLNRFNKIGILGHSEGGTIAFMLGAEKIPDFIVSMAGMSMPAKETILDQNRSALKNQGFYDDEIEQTIAILNIAFDQIAEDVRNNRETKIDFDKIVKYNHFEVDPLVLNSLKSNSQLDNRWLRYFLTIVPKEYLKEVTCPVLALNGEKDTQVEAQANLDIIRSTLPSSEIHKLKDLNHLFQHSTTGKITEYSEIKETISPEVLEIMVNFIKKNNK